jgi:hypothetical protein
VESGGCVESVESEKGEEGEEVEEVEESVNNSSLGAGEQPIIAAQVTIDKIVWFHLANFVSNI